MDAIITENLNRLKNQRVYLAGAMDRAYDRGNGWRDYITPLLEQLGIVVFNPIKKPGSIGMEDAATHELKLHLKKNQEYAALSLLMKTIRSVDLRLVDISDFLIVNLDLDIHPCGTYEEIFWANRQKKPILIRVVQGKQSTPDWLFGTIPHELFFDTWDDIIKYLSHINTDINVNTLNRWWFCNV